MIRALASIYAHGGVCPANSEAITAALQDYDRLLHDPFIHFYLEAKRNGWPITFARPADNGDAQR